jgi:hypothetical protein
MKSKENIIESFAERLSNGDVQEVISEVSKRGEQFRKELREMGSTIHSRTPVLHGFAGEPEAKFFYGQAANELTVIASTNWDAGMSRHSRRIAA